MDPFFLIVIVFITAWLYLACAFYTRVFAQGGGANHDAGERSGAQVLQDLARGDRAVGGGRRALAEIEGRDLGGVPGSSSNWNSLGATSPFLSDQDNFSEDFGYDARWEESHKRPEDLHFFGDGLLSADSDASMGPSLGCDMGSGFSGSSSDDLSIGIDDGISGGIGGSIGDGML